VPYQFISCEEASLSAKSYQEICLVTKICFNLESKRVLYKEIQFPFLRVIKNCVVLSQENYRQSQAMAPIWEASTRHLIDYGKVCLGVNDTLRARSLSLEVPPDSSNRYGAFEDN
jgi:hypothetical protein